MPASALAALLILSAARTAPRSAPQPLAQAKAAPASVRELGGYMLNQYVKGIEKGLGKPARTGTDDDDDAKLWHYDLAPNSATILTLSVSDNEEETEPGEDTRRVTTLLLTGAPKPGLTGLHGVNLGDTRAKVIERLGTPTTVEAVDDLGERLMWNGRNYSVGVTTVGVVISLQIDEGEEYFTPMADSQPDVAGFRAALQSRDRETILEWVASDLDLYTKSDDVVGFVGSPRENILNEESLVARYLFGGTGSVRDLLTEDLVSKGEGERDEDEKTTWYTTFPEGSAIGRILWTYEAGRWRVWDVDLDPFEGAEDRAAKRRTTAR